MAPLVYIRMTDMRYLAIPVAALAFGILFASSAAAQTKVCTMEYAPVCAAKQVQCIKAPCYPVYQTYSNSCMASADNARIIHQGECSANESGPVKPAEFIPPASCTAWFDGCNYCSKTPTGATMCTKRACIEGTEQPGYCTAYEKGTPVPATSSPTVEPLHPTTTEATSTPANESGMFHRFWNWLRHLLRFS